MVSKEQRRRELARAKLARQQAKRESDAKRRQVLAVVAAAVGVLLVVGAITYLSLGDDDAPPTAGSTPTTSSGATPSTSASPEETTGGPAGTCQYRPAGEATKPITPPPDGPAPELASASTTITTDQGVVEIELDPAAAPCTVQSFLALADGAFYDGTTCHRLTTGGLAVLQCGDPTGTGSGGPGYEYDDETTPNLTYDRGTVAMANAGPGTNGSQFFLVYGDSQLPPDYTVFGTITAGLESLDAIAAAGVADGGTDGAPATAVTITGVETESAL